MSGARSFLDTNIFLYLFDRKAPLKAARARGLISSTVAGGGGAVSYQVIQEFYNVSLTRFDPVMTAVQAERFLSETFLPLHIVNLSTTLIRDAFRVRERLRFSWYDSLIVAAALEARCNILFSEDLQHGQKFGSLRVENPFL